MSSSFEKTDATCTSSHLFYTNCSCMTDADTCSPMIMLPDFFTSGQVLACTTSFGAQGPGKTLHKASPLASLLGKKP